MYVKSPNIVPTKLNYFTFLIQVLRSEANGDATRVTLILSPLDDQAVHTIYCMADQGGANGSHTVARKIDVYPGDTKTFDWDLYKRLRDLQLKR